MAALGRLRPLSAKYKQDFAYPTVKDRLPVILTRVVDVIHRTKNDKTLTEVQLEDLKSIVGHLSRLKFELQTDKPLTLLDDEGRDLDTWNKKLLEDKQEHLKSSWFKSAWLYTECYFYRRINEAILKSDQLKHFDPFWKQKCDALHVSQPAMNSLALHLLDVLSNLKENASNFKACFNQLIQISLWGNKCDLSISAGADNPQITNPIDQLERLSPYLICDDAEKVWNHLAKDVGGKVRVDIVLDNAGFELFTDLIFADFLVTSGLATEVYMHGKAMPWFVSDVTKCDFEWTLKELRNFDALPLKKLSDKWQNLLEKGSWVFEINDFWTSPYDFSHMKSVSPDLYSSLQNATIIFFKGDLNYRKLVADLTWDFTTPFSKALQGFHPAPVCALRALKCDCCVGLPAVIAEEKQKINNHDWMLDGSYGVIQFCSDKHV